MGTGSHRPQLEAAKGRTDITGGIRHSRALKSHTKLKYRAPLEIKPLPKLIETATYNAGSDIDVGNGGESNEDDEDELKKELAVLEKRNALRDLLKKPVTASAYKWKSEAVFKRKKKESKSSDAFLDKYIH